MEQARIAGEMCRRAHGAFEHIGGEREPARMVVVGPLPRGVSVQQEVLGLLFVQAHTTPESPAGLQHPAPIVTTHAEQPELIEHPGV